MPSSITLELFLFCEIEIKKTVFKNTLKSELLAVWMIYEPKYSHKIIPNPNTAKSLWAGISKKQCA